ncbi:hypothetical protein BDV23DRAFT_181023 [Aspergillus alliaceus]|uniref:Uncharacterized protein n=1 Tax=Petromyces alliaceus TaxID=209559 RepID=A0A5N7CGY9_PETAA|nr:hypothetical protein BDV23DRAFT_181023 [Aspergillus alliaceus]
MNSFNMLSLPHATPVSVAELFSSYNLKALAATALSDADKQELTRFHDSYDITLPDQARLGLGCPPTIALHLYRGIYVHAPGFARPDVLPLYGPLIQTLSQLAHLLHSQRASMERQ